MPKEWEHKETVDQGQDSDGARETTGISDEGMASMQGVSDAPPDAAKPPGDADNPAKKGSEFEQWAQDNVFHGKGERLVIRPEDNPHLDKLGDGVGITKERRVSDAYVADDGSLWDMKAGYDKGGIDQDQLYEYSLMEDAGHVFVQRGGERTKVPVTSVNYLFDTQAGAEANYHDLRGRASVWYKDAQDQVNLYKPKEKQE